MEKRSSQTPGKRSCPTCYNCHQSQNAYAYGLSYNSSHSITWPSLISKQMPTNCLSTTYKGQHGVKKAQEHGFYSNLAEDDIARARDTVKKAIEHTDGKNTDHQEELDWPHDSSNEDDYRTNEEIDESYRLLIEEKARIDAEISNISARTEATKLKCLQLQTRLDVLGEKDVYLKTVLAKKKEENQQLKQKLSRLKAANSRLE